MKRVKVYLFGASNGGRIVKENLSRNVEVLGFVDNDFTKQGEMLDGLPILSPDVISDGKFDFVVVSSMYVSEITAELIQKGISRDRIIIPTLDRRLILFPWDAVLLLGIVVLLASLFGFFAMIRFLS